MKSVCGKLFGFLETILRSKYVWLTLTAFLAMVIFSGFIVAFSCFFLLWVIYLPIISAINNVPHKKPSFVFVSVALILIIVIAVFMIAMGISEILHFSDSSQTQAYNLNYIASPSLKEAMTAILWPYIIALSIFVLIDSDRKHGNQLQLLIKAIFTKLSRKSNFELKEPKGSLTVVYSGAMCELLIKKGLGHFLLADFSPKYSLLQDKHFNKTKARNILGSIMIDIFKHLELPPFVELIIIDENDNEIFNNADRVGQFSSTHQKKKIIIKTKKQYSIINIVAILCHECTHYFMEYNGLNWDDVHLNEKRTDIMANLIGFSEVMIKGYRVISTERVYGNIRNTITHRIGYITDSECAEVRQYLLWKRYILEKQKKDNAELLNVKVALSKHIEVAKTLYEQISSIDLRSKCGLQNISNPMQLAKLQKVLLEYENRDIENELLRYQVVLTSNIGMEKTIKANESAMKLCADILCWISAFQSNN